MNVKHSIYTFGCSEVSKTTCTGTVAKSCFDIPGSSWGVGWQRLQDDGQGDKAAYGKEQGLNVSLLSFPA